MWCIPFHSDYAHTMHYQLRQSGEILHLFQSHITIFNLIVNVFFVLLSVMRCFLLKCKYTLDRSIRVYWCYCVKQLKETLGNSSVIACRKVQNSFCLLFPFILFGASINP